jgi:uncharacterized membrane protein
VGQEEPSTGGAVDQELVELVESLPSDTLLKMTEVLGDSKTREILRHSSVEMTSFSGPWPHPAIVKGYEELNPGAAAEFIDFANREQAHRHEMDKGRLETSRTLAVRGQVFALVVALVAMGIGGACLLTGRNVYGFVLLLTPLAVLLGVFIWWAKKPSGEENQTTPP